MSAEPEIVANGVEPQSLTGIDGWLALFVVGNIVTVGILCVSLFFILQTLAGGTPPGRSEDLVVALVTATIWLASTLGGLFLVVTKRRWAPLFWVLFLPFVFLLDLLLTVALEAPTNVSTESPSEATTASVGRTFIYSVIWFIYWIRSRRVRQTFGSSGFQMLKKSHRNRLRIENRRD